MFDVSYLWEEYIAILLKKLDFEHPENINLKGKIKLLDSKSGTNWICYPDFYNNNVVIDAKYKKIDNFNDVGKEDRYQLLTYMYILGLKYGFFIHPVTNCNKLDIAELNLKNKDEKSTVGIYHFKIPQKVSSMKDFCSKISLSENEFKEYIQ